MHTRALVVVSAPPDRSTSALQRAGVTDVELVTGDLPDALRQVAGRLRERDRLIVLDADAVLSVAALGRLVDDPSVGTALLVAPQLTDAAQIRVEHGHVVSAASDNHQASGAQTASLGALVVQTSRADAAAAAIQEMAECAAQQGWTGDVVDHVVVALVRREVPVMAVTAPGSAARSQDSAVRDALAAELAAGGDDLALRESANRVDDGFYSTFVLRRLSKPLTELALRLGLSPNQVSLISFAVGLAAAGLFAVGQFAVTVVAALLLQLSLVIDCVDGEVARRTRRFSALGAWLDASTDRVKEYAVYAGLAVAGTDLWLLAGIVLVMQTTRHMTDYDFNRVQRARETWVEPRDLADPGDGGAPSYGAALDASRRASGYQWVRWAKKALHMPIGERWLVISVVSVVGGPTAVFVTLLVLGMVAAAYTTTGRLLRVRPWRHPAQRSGASVLQPQLDLGPFAGALWCPTMTGRFAWAGPAALRLVELGSVLLATALVAPDAMPWAYALLFVLAYHHYDTLYRALGGEAPPRWLVWGGLGVEGRLGLVAVAALLGEAALSGGLVVATVALAGWFVVVASAQLVRSLPVGGGA